MIVLFDLDGVLANFVGGALAVHDKKLPMAETVWDFPAQIGFTGSSDPSFWEPLSNRHFWANLEPHFDGMDLFHRVVKLLPKDRIGFLSSAAVPGSADGKRDWIAKHLPGWESHLILGSNKGLVADSTKLLIDDFDYNIDKFRANGGIAVTAPRPWNRASARTKDGWFSPDEVYAEIEEIRLARF